MVSVATAVLCALPHILAVSARLPLHVAYVLPHSPPRKPPLKALKREASVAPSIRFNQTLKRKWGCSLRAFFRASAGL